MFKRKVLCLILACFLMAVNLGGCSGSTANIPVNTLNSETPNNGTNSPGVLENTATPQGGASSYQPYEVTSEYLKDPNLMINIANQSASFWEKAYDPEFGGFFTYVNREGTPDMTQPYKVSWIQSRASYGFAKAYQMTGKDEYLFYSRQALDFLYEHCWDDVNGGWYQEVNRDGSLPSEPLLPGMDWNSLKWLTLFTASQISPMVEVTRNDKDTQWLKKAHRVLEEKMWDSRPGYEGYFEQAQADWSQARNKTLGSIEGGLQEALTVGPYLNGGTHMGELANILANRFANNLGQQRFGMTELYDSNWNKQCPQPTTTTAGNFIKPAWFLAMAYLEEPKDAYKEGTEKFIDEVLYSRAYDTQYGGFYDTLNYSTGEPTDKKKGWWVVGQSVITGLIAHYITGNYDYLKMADGSMTFFMQNLYDQEYGDAYCGVNGDGTNPDTSKGNYFKGFLHSMELYYYTYLYGNLMIQHKPVTLYYHFDPKDTKQEITVKPLEMGEKYGLKIAGVTLDGETFDSYDATGCTLNIPPQVGGEFKVTFKPYPIQ